MPELGLVLAAGPRWRRSCPHASLENDPARRDSPSGGLFGVVTPSGSAGGAAAAIAAFLLDIGFAKEALFAAEAGHALFARAADGRGQAELFRTTVASAHARLGDTARATSVVEASVAMYRSLGDVRGEMGALTALLEVHQSRSAIEARGLRGPLRAQGALRCTMSLPERVPRRVLQAGVSPTRANSDLEIGGSTPRSRSHTFGRIRVEFGLAPKAVEVPTLGQMGPNMGRN